MKGRKVKILFGSEAGTLDKVKFFDPVEAEIIEVFVEKGSDVMFAYLANTLYYFTATDIVEFCN